jgi:hypothetical protein
MKKYRFTIFRWLARLTGARVNEDFIILFLIKEGKVLLGKRFINVVYLFLIMFVTFLAIGIANGSLDYLKVKMDDPFISWVPVNIPYEKADSVSEYIKLLNEDTTAREQIQYVSVSAFKYLYLQFFSENEIDKSRIKGRTVEIKDDLLNELCSSKNLIAGRKFRSNQEIGLIISEKLMKKLNYTSLNHATYIKMAITDPFNEKELIPFPLPVIGVVHDLPGNTGFLCTPAFYYHSKEAQEKPFNPNKIFSVDLLVETEKRKEQLKSDLDTFFDKEQRFSKYDPHVYTQPDTLSFHKAYKVTIDFEPEPNLAERNEIFSAISADKAVSRNTFLRYYDYSALIDLDTQYVRKYDFISIKLDDLNGVTPLDEYLQSKFQLPIDMAQRETRRNYAFVSNLTNIISLCLIVFSILSICFYITSLLQHHLDQMKMNIGTFKAFGLMNSSLDRIYLSIVYTVIISTMAGAMTFSWIVARLGGVKLLFTLSGQVEDNELYFTLVRPWFPEVPIMGWTLFSIIMILLTSYSVLKYITGKIFKRTPGDLIYDRNEEYKD